ncbi:MAG: hypothetical protein M1840_007129 [Geoglossum simile]|nr:MAG: hypothetical protein M1840_007129 [Geoglossum simile]
MNELGDALTRLGLSQYFKRFVQEGFDTWETVLDITESDLESLNKLQREIASARGQSAEQPLGAPTRPLPTEGVVPDRGEGTSSAKSELKDNSGSGKRKYRRHPKPDENAPERPSSAYVIFSNKIREDVKEQNLSFTEIAKRVGESWQLLPATEKESYESEALAAKETYSTELRQYKTTEFYREYTQYLVDFKAKLLKDQVGKRPKLGSSTYVVSSSESATGGRKQLPPRRARVGSISSVGTYDSMTSDQTSPSLASLQVSWLNNPLAIQHPQDPSPSTHLSHGDSIVRSRQDPCSPRHQLLSEQQLPGILSIKAPLRRPRPHGRVSEPSGDEIPQLNSVLSSPLKPSYSSSESSLSSKCNTSSSPPFTPATPRDDRNDRVHRALPPPPASSITSAGPCYFGPRTQPTSLPGAGHQTLSHSFRIPPRPPQIVIAKGQKLEEASSGPPGNANLTC